MLKPVIGIYAASREDIGDLVTYRAFPAGNLTMEDLNPFIFLNHHGPQDYPGNNSGLPFGPHPHRGIETVTFIIDGELTHSDSSGSKSRITSGGIQWMTAGKGIIHSEVSSDEFKKNGGSLEILQLWLNLPKKFKMTEPFYKGLQAGEIPGEEEDEGKVKIKIISGNRSAGAFEAKSEASIRLLEFSKGGVMKTAVPEGHVVFFYVVKGAVTVNENSVSEFNLVRFGSEGEDINIEAGQDSIVILGNAGHLREPVAAQGPFVMNSYEEIMQAYSDFRDGKFR